MDLILTSSCRLCLMQPASDAPVFSVFDTYQGNVLADLIGELFSLKITKSDQLMSMCLDCVNRINTVRKIQQLFVENDRKLHEWLQYTGQPDTIDEKNEAYEMYELTDVNHESPELETGAARSPIDQCYENTAAHESKLLEENVQPSLACGTDANKETVVMFEIDDENGNDIEVTFESDTECGSLADDKSVRQEDEKMDTETGEARLLQNKCYFCGRIFQNAIDFTYHLPEHFAQMPYTCLECDGLVFKKVQLASKHIGMHDVHDRPFQCRVCPLRFVTRCNSLTHERKMHRYKIKQQSIARKPKSTALLKPRQRNDLSLDARRAPSDRTGGHRCEICSKTFTAKKNLTRHLMVHTGETPFKCAQCNRSFRQAGELKLHHKVHQSQETYWCDPCNTSYRSFSMLAKHRKAEHVYSRTAQTGG